MSASPQTIVRLAFLCLMLALSSPLFAEGSHEIGVLGGFTSYRSVNVSNPERSGKAGAKEGPAAGFVLGQSMGNHWGGEFRYLYFRNDLQLEGAAPRRTSRPNLTPFTTTFCITQTARRRGCVPTPRLASA